MVRKQSIGFTVAFLMLALIEIACAESIVPEGADPGLISSSGSRASLDGVSIPRKPSISVSRNLKVLKQLERFEKKRKKEAQKRLKEKLEKKLEKKLKAEVERKRMAEVERKRMAEAEKKRMAEAERKRQVKAEKKGKREIAGRVASDVPDSAATSSTASSSSKIWCATEYSVSKTSSYSCKQSSGKSYSFESQAKVEHKRLKADSASGDQSDSNAYTVQISPSRALATESPTRELEFWQSVKSSEDPVMFEAYLAIYPNGVFSRLAKIKLRRIEQESNLDVPLNAVVLIWTNEGEGAGVVIDDTGLIVTNWHVVADAKQGEVNIKLFTSDFEIRQHIYSGQVIKVNRKKDLALIQIRTNTDLVVFKLGSMNRVKISMPVHAIGHPLSHYWTYTTGSVSQIRKNFSWSDVSSPDGSKHRATVIQTQTPVNPGNSGGPLFANNSDLIGINSFRNEEADGINFAIAIDEVKQFLRDIPSPSPPQSGYPHPLSEYAAESFDTDKDGKMDLYGFDTDDNGKTDLWARDLDDDDKEDDGEWTLDQNENDIKDGYILDASRYLLGATGKIWVFDINEDGEPEMYGHDEDGDGRIDSWHPIG